MRGRVRPDRGGSRRVRRGGAREGGSTKCRLGGRAFSRPACAVVGAGLRPAPGASSAGGSPEGRGCWSSQSPPLSSTRPGGSRPEIYAMICSAYPDHDCAPIGALGLPFHHHHGFGPVHFLPFDGTEGDLVTTLELSGDFDKDHPLVLPVSRYNFGVSAGLAVVLRPPCAVSALPGRRRGKDASAGTAWRCIHDGRKGR